jgi:hypothetical protein
MRLLVQVLVQGALRLNKDQVKANHEDKCKTQDWIESQKCFMKLPTMRNQDEKHMRRIAFTP